MPGRAWRAGLVVLVLLTASCGDDEPTTADATTTSATAAPEPDGPGGEVVFQPVLQTLSPPEIDSCVEPGLLTVDGTECLELGEETMAAVESASARVSPLDGTWGVELVLTQDGIAVFNDVAATCFVREPACPVGRLAIVVDGEVTSAPAIQQPSFERDQIQITGDFDEAQARDLADALSS